MNDIQKPIFGCVVPANGSFAENMRYMASSVDTIKVDSASCVEDGEALHSVFAESSMSSQGSDPFAEEATNRHAFPQSMPAVAGTSSQGSDLFAEVFKILATSEYDDLAKQVRNTPVFPQEKQAVSSMSSQGFDPSAEEATNHHAFSQARPAVSSMRSQGSDKFAEILKILATPEYDDLANQVANIYAFSQAGPAESSSSIAATNSQGSDPSAREARNRHAFSQKRPAESSSSIAGTSSQGFDPSVRKKIKRNNDAESSEAQQAQSKNADTAYSKRACMRLDGRKLKINERIIRLGSREIAFVKLLFEKRNTYVPTDDLHVAVYGGEAGGWKKDILQKRKRFYSLLANLHKKLPKDCFEGELSKGYMLSGSVMTSQGSPSAREEIKCTLAQREMVYSSGIGMNIEKKKLEIDGESFVFRSQEFKVLELLFEKINTFVSLDDLYVAAYGEDEALPAAFMQKRRLYKLFFSLRNQIPEGYIKGHSNIGYMLSNPVDMTSQGSDPSAQKRMKNTDDSASFKASESEEGGCNLQEIQYDSEDSSLIGNYYTDDYARFAKDTESIRSRYIKVRKSPGFVRIGGICIFFIENKFTIDGRQVVFRPREIQVLRLLALWYPDVVPCEQIYYNLSFGVNGNYVSVDKRPEIKKRYIIRLISRVKTRLKSDADRIRIMHFKREGYKLVCYSNQQTSPNESSVQDTLHSQSTGSSS